MNYATWQAKKKKEKKGKKNRQTPRLQFVVDDRSQQSKPSWHQLETFCSIFISVNLHFLSATLSHRPIKLRPEKGAFLQNKGIFQWEGKPAAEAICESAAAAQASVAMCNKLISLPAVNTVSSPPQSLDGSNRLVIRWLSLLLKQAGTVSLQTVPKRGQTQWRWKKICDIWIFCSKIRDNNEAESPVSQVCVASLNISHVPSLKSGTLCWASLLCSYENDDWTSADFSPSRPSTIWSAALAMPPILYSHTSSRLLELDGVGF